MPLSTVHVQYGDGSPGRGVGVQLSFATGGMTNTVYADNQGRAIIEHAGSGSASIFANGQDCGTMRAPGIGHARI